MKILKAIFAMFFVLFSVSMMNAQSCMGGIYDLNMQIEQQETQNKGTVCFDVYVSGWTDLPIGPGTLFIQVEGTSYEFVSAPGAEEFSATVCFETPFTQMIAPIEVTIVCGVAADSDAEHPLCEDGCTVTIEPIDGRG